MAFPPPTAPDSTDRIQLVLLPPPPLPRVRRPVAFPSPVAVAVWAAAVVVVVVVVVAVVPVASSAAVQGDRSQCAGIPIWKRRYDMSVAGAPSPSHGKG